MTTAAETLYDTDFRAWTEHVAARLRAGQVKGLDLENIAEEIESLGKRDYRTVQSRLERLILHMLKWDYQPTKRSRSWIATIGEQRRRLRRILDDSPSLVLKARAELRSRYANAIEAATVETGLTQETFPTTCPYTWQVIFEREFPLTAPSPDSLSRPS